MSTAPTGYFLPDATTSPFEESQDAPHGLVVRLRRGDAVALGLVYEQHHTHVRAFAQRLVGDESSAEDMVQEVFLALPNAIARYRGESSLRTFLISIAVNCSRHFVRAASRRRAAMSRFSLEPQPHAGGDPEHASTRRQLADRLTHALDALPMEQRVAVVLCEVEERTSREAATIVGVPEATIRTRLFHAKRKLRQILAGEMGTDGAEEDGADG